MTVTGRIEHTPTVSGRPVTRTAETLSEELRLYYMTALGKSDEEIKADLDAGLYPMIEHELNSKVEQSDQEVDQGFVDYVLATQPDLESATKAIQDELAGNIFEGHYAPDIAAILNESNAQNKYERQLIERSIAAQRIIDRHTEKYGDSWTEYAGAFGDMIVSEGVQNLLGGVTGSEVFESAWQLQDLAKEASQLLYMNLPKEEFEKEFESIIQRVEDMGFLTEENPFFFNQFVDMIREGGVGAEAAIATAFGSFDIALAPLSVPFATIGGGLKNVPRVITQVGGATRAADVIVSQAAKNADSPVVVANTAPRMVSPGVVGENLWSAPDLSVMRRLEANNAALSQVKAANFGNYIDEEIINAKAIEFLEETQDRLPGYPRQEMNYEVRVDEGGNIWGGVILGKRSNSVNDVVQPYKLRQNAQAFADSIGGEVIEVMDNGAAAYVVRKEVGLPTALLAETTDISQVATHMLSGWMSTTARTTVNLDGRIKQAEAQIARTLSELNSRFNRISRKVSAEEKIQTDGLLRQFRDDPLYNWRTEAMDVDEFEVEFTKKYGVAPSEQNKEYYIALSEINDVDYYLTADRLLKEAINNGEEMVRVDGNYYRSRRVTELEADTQVWDPSLNRYRLVSDYNEKAQFFELHEFPELNPASGAVRYVVMDSPITRRLYHTDVLGYNFGGHRSRDGTINFYIKQERELTLGSGQTVPGRPRTIMGTRLENEAMTAVEEINTILDETRKVLGSTPVGNARQVLTGNKALDLVVQGNNSWNRNVEDIEDFIQFAEDYGLDLTRKVEVAPDGEPIIGQDFVGNETVGQYFRSSRLTRGRGMKPLMAFGGHELESVDPTSAIQRGYVQSVSRYGNQAYVHNAMAGWLKAAQQTGALQNADKLAIKSNPRQAFEDAKFSTKTAAGKALEAERRTIRFRLNQTTADMRWYQTHVKNMADWVYGKGSKKAASVLDWAASKDPTAFFRFMAFNLKMGIFALPQLYTQAAQMINIVGIVGPKIGMQAMVGVLPMRMALLDNIPQAALERIAKVQQTFTGLTPDEFIELRNWINKSGRFIIDKTAIEENNAFTFYKPGLLTSISRAGLVFFNEGERVARIGAAIANRLELKAQNFVGDIFSDSVTRRMIQHQDKLTASMTAASAAPWQKSLLSLPLQFQTYNMRMMEQLFTSNILTPVERLRLGITHLVVFGAAGVPLLGWQSDKLAYEHGLDIDHASYEIARYGAMDAMLSLITGEDTALSTRLAFGEGLTDFFRKVFSGETPFIELIAGPGGTITQDVFGTIGSFGKNLFSGNWDYTTYDWNRLGRNISGYESAYRLWVGMKTGEHISRRTQDVLMSDMSAVDVLLHSAGIPLKQIDIMWNIVLEEKADKKQLEQHALEARRLQKIAIEYLNDGNYEAANRVAEDIGAMRQILPPHQKDLFDRRVFKGDDIFDALIRRMINQGKFEIAEDLQNYMRN